MATPNYDIDYNDPRFTEVETEKNEALTDNEKLYGGMIEDSEAYYNSQIEASKDWADKQTQIQNEQTEFAIDQIEQQKEQANKDYLKEQSGSYVDWQKQSNQYGANAEKMAASGLTNTGYSESSQVSMYNTYQNRVAVARQTFSQAVLNYNNAIKDARLQNNAALAQIAYDTFQKQAELALANFQYKNTLLTQMATQKTTIEQNYYNRYLAVLEQINRENELAESVRQFEEEKKLEEAKLAEEQRQFDTTFAEQQRQYNASVAEEQRQFNLSIDKSNGGSSGGSSGGRSSISSTKEANDEKIATKQNRESNTEVSTAYYRGDLNPDAKKYGTFSNGYQPKGISGHGKLVRGLDVSGGERTVEVSTVVQYGVDKGKKQTLVQAVWVADDGTEWYWEGRKNKYIQIKD